jgi:hypothetical protein
MNNAHNIIQRIITIAQARDHTTREMLSLIGVLRDFNSDQITLFGIHRIGARNAQIGTPTTSVVENHSIPLINRQIFADNPAMRTSDDSGDFTGQAIIFTAAFGAIDAHFDAVIGHDSRHRVACDIHIRVIAIIWKQKSEAIGVTLDDTLDG